MVIPGNPLHDEVFLDCKDGYGNLIDKSVGVCKYAAANGYEYIFKADTDTWVYAEKLLVEMMETAFDYAGFLHANVCSGGPGYFLSAHAAAIIASKGEGWRHPYAEDVHVSRVLAEHNNPARQFAEPQAGLLRAFLFRGWPFFRRQ